MTDVSPPETEIDSSHQKTNLGSQEGSRGGQRVPKDARAVANFILDEAKRDGKSLTPMQLIKLVYLAHGWFMAWYNEPLIDEYVQAWQYGPVIRSVYDAFKKYGRYPIERPTYGEYDMLIDIGVVDLASKTDPFKPQPIRKQFCPEEKNIISEIYRAYGHLSGAQLSALTHQDGSPWHQTYSPHKRDQVIDPEVIKSHFKALSKRNQEFLAKRG